MLTKSEIQLVKSLRSKKFRQKYNQFIVEGEKAVAEALQNNLEVVQVFGTEEWRTLYLPLLGKVPYTTVNTKELERISGFEQPNKALALLALPQTDFDTNTFNEHLTIALDFIQDPGNLGTIIRTADWYGIKHIVCSENCVDAFSPKVINATMGSFARVQVHYVNLEEVLTPYANRLYACVMNGTSVYEIKNADKPIVLIGNEGKGISDSLLQLAQNKISIPRRGKAESLNAAVATAVIVDCVVRVLP